jgi:hypothetical protein
MHEELDKTGVKKLVEYFKLSSRAHGETEENHKTLRRTGVSAEA